MIVANILLTQKCIRSCPYCFAEKHMADSPPEDVLSWENLIYIIDLMEVSGERAVSLLGGEPTLHPRFVDYVIYLLERQFHVNVFTSGVMSDRMSSEIEHALSGVDPSRLSFVCNVNNPAGVPFSEQESVKRFLRTVGHLTTPGFNLYRRDFDLDFIFQYINDFGMNRHIRLGLAHPIPGRKNAFVQIDDMHKLVDRLVSYLPKFRRLRIKPGFDCGMPMCIFTDVQLGQLFRVFGGHLSFGCGPAIDIGPDMSVWSCFPLSSFHRRSLYEFDSFRDIIRFYEDLHTKVRVEAGGIFEKCDDCSYREDQLCSGGCLAHTLSHFQNEAPVRDRKSVV